MVDSVIALGHGNFFAVIIPSLFRMFASYHHLTFYLEAPRSDVHAFRNNMQSQNYVDKTVKELRHCIYYLIEKTNWVVKKYYEEEVRKEFVEEKNSRESSNVVPLMGLSEGGNYRDKSPGIPDGVHIETSQGKGWEEFYERVLGGLKGACWICVNELPFWGLVGVSTQLKVLVISVFTGKWAIQYIRCWTDLRE